MSASVVPQKKPVSVTLLSGFLGSGKTSLLKHVLQNREGIRCAVIVNEITEENIDAYALGGTKLLQEKEQFVEMSNGCICCTLRADLLKQLRELAASNLFDSVLIESSGISEPMQVAQTFMTDLKDGLGPLNNVARLDTCVTVVDASTMMERLREELDGKKVVLASGMDDGATSCVVKKDQPQQQQQQQQLSSPPPSATGGATTQSIGQLLAEQIEFANVVLINKIDRVAVNDCGDDAEGGGDEDVSKERREREVQKIVQVVRSLNPTARVIPTTHGKVPLEHVLNTGSCTEEFASSVKGWMTDIAETHTPETEEYGVVNYTFRSKTPFHPLRLHQWITSMWLLDEMKEDEEEDDDAAHDDDDDDDSSSESSSSSDDGDDNSAAKTRKSRRSAAAVAAALQVQKQKKRVRSVRTTRYGGEIFRCKGFAWVGNCSRLGFFVTISAAGDSLSFLPGGGWGSFPVRAGAGTTQIEPCQTLAFLGQYLNKTQLQKDLEALLLTPEELVTLKKAMMVSAAAAGPPPDVFDDPFVAFGQEDDEEHDHDRSHGDGHNHQHHHHRRKKN